MLKIFTDTNPNQLEEAVNQWLKDNFPIEVTSISYTHNPEESYSIALYYQKNIIDW